MISIENIFICMIAPLVVAAICANRNARRVILFCVVGMGMCMLSAYVNAFIVQIEKADVMTVTIEITPVIEEIMKLLPLLFYLIIFEAEKERAQTAIIGIAVGFATLENVYYLIANGTENISLLLVRGFGTGAMHILCGAIVAYGIIYVWKKAWLKIPGTFGLLCTAITFHGVYNMLIGVGGIVTKVTYIAPILIVIAISQAMKKIK